jgi:hypothetical protein
VYSLRSGEISAMVRRAFPAMFLILGEFRFHSNVSRRTPLATTKLQNYFIVSSKYFLWVPPVPKYLEIFTEFLESFKVFTVARIIILELFLVTKFNILGISNLDRWKT